VTRPGPAAAVESLRGVGPALAEKLHRLGITTVLDLLLHLPHRYQDRTRVTPLGAVRAGSEVLVIGQVVDSRVTFGRRRSWLVTLGDDSGFLQLRFFHFNERQRQSASVGTYLRCFGEVRPGPNGFEMVHPEYRAFGARPDAPEPELTPIYPITEGLSQARLAGIVAQALPLLTEVPRADLEELLREPLPGLVDSLATLHRPPASATGDDLERARSRVALDELLAKIVVLKQRAAERHEARTLPLPSVNQLGRVLLDNLGFELTGAQRRVAREVLQDLTRDRPMLRLIQGDVGSGKTVIAAFAAVRAAEHGCQTAIMAPTEILAEQHYVNFSNWLEPLGIGVRLLTGSMSAAERSRQLAGLATGETLVAVGTHALFQQEVDFARLALVIIDEQHRFGVHQRMALRSKGRLPHQLVMTATPIPRTLTMALYADMDVSVIDELPPGRQPVQTRVVSAERRNEVIDHIGAAVAAGQQAYWVCTLIEDSDTLEFRAAETTARELAEAMPAVRVGLLHGRMASRDKARVMEDFKSGAIDLLVATTVVEVGVDVPNATLMVIENPERLGLAQLHQLRGRVGRGRARSRCVLLYKPPLGSQSRARLNVMRTTSDGFRIAEEDLKLRGPGDVLGARQTGEETFRVADLTRDAALVEHAARLATRICAEAPEISERLIAMWSPGGGDYTHV
jgi:ATP-dependent DNA helicase RecG